MKKLFILLALVSSIAAHAQNIRWDLGAPGAAGAVTVGPGSYLVSLSAVDLNWCTHPANAVPCTNFANTYPTISSASPCSTATQIVLQGSTNCVATSDNFGNLGVWTLPNNTCGSGITCYDYTLTANGVSYGPYTWTAGVGTSGISGVSGSGTNNTLPVWTGSTSLGNSYFSESGGPGQNGVVQLNAGTLEFDTTLCPSGGCGVMTFPSPSNFGGIFMNTNSTEIFPNVNFLNAFKVNGDGAGNNYIAIPQESLANAPSAGISSMFYCTTCHTNTNPCSTSGGTGSGTFAFQVNGTWVCPF